MASTLPAEGTRSPAYSAERRLAAGSRGLPFAGYYRRVSQLWPWRAQFWPRRINVARWLPWAEAGVIVTWAVWFTRAFANWDPTMWPAAGQDYPNSILTYFNWTWLSKCGLCVLWNGSVNGGAPMLADYFTPILHPALVVPVLLWGGFNGAKITLILSAVMAGLGQWWLAKVLRVGLVARMWVALLAVVSGHLWARMEYGTIVMTFSIAASSLLFAPMLDLALHGRRLSVVWLGLMMSSAVLSGQGYMELAIVIGALPPMILFFFTPQFRLRPVWRSFAAAAVITVCLTALWWVPLAVFWPYITKAGDPTFALAQKNVIYSLFNLFIGDDTFLRTALLGKTDALSLYSNYIGWIPVVLAVVAIWKARRKDWRIIAYLLLAIWLIYLTSTTWLYDKLPFVGNFLAIGRDPSLEVALAVPLILSLAALGLDALIRSRWPVLALSTVAGGNLRIGLGRLVLIPAIWSIYVVYAMTSSWVLVAPAPDIYPIREVRTPTTQWVSAPIWLPFYPPKAIDAGLKFIVPLEHTARNWGQGRVRPQPYIFLTTDAVDSTTAGYIGNALGINMILMEKNQYASIQNGDQLQPCQAQAQAGNIDVVCDAAQAGVLTVYENNWTGWNVYRDGRAAQLLPGNWLQAEAPAGTHTYQFRYRPWDVGVGFILTLIGLGLIFMLLVRQRRTHSRRGLPAGDDRPWLILDKFRPGTQR